MRTLKEIRTDWREALKELEIANREYSKYLAEPLMPGENPIPIPIPFDELKAATDKLNKARKKDSQFRNEYIEAEKAGITE